MKYREIGMSQKEEEQLSKLKDYLDKLENDLNSLKSLNNTGSTNKELSDEKKQESTEQDKDASDNSNANALEELNIVKTKLQEYTDAYHEIKNFYDDHVNNHGQISAEFETQYTELSGKYWARIQDLTDVIEYINNKISNIDII